MVVHSNPEQVKSGTGGSIFIVSADKSCDICNKECNEGYICENEQDKLICPKCQDKWNMLRCKHDKKGEHRHIKVIVENPEDIKNE